MPTPSPTPAPVPGSARDRLLEAARELFTGRPYDEIAVADITGAAGTSVGSLYYHFGGKAEIYNALYQAYLQRQEQRIRQTLRSARELGVADPRRLFLAGTRAYLTGMWHDRQVSRLFVERPPSARGGDGGDWVARNARLLAGSAPASLPTQVIAAAVAGAMGTWGRELASVDDDERAREFIEQALLVVARMVGIGDDAPGSASGTAVDRLDALDITS